LTVSILYGIVYLLSNLDGKERTVDYDSKAALRAGLFYLAAAVFYIFGMMYVEGRGYRSPS